MDENIGRIIEELKAQNIYDEMYIVWSSDHGDMMGDHYLWRKGFAMESSTHIPLVIRWPESKSEEYSAVGKGGIVDALVEVRDIAPTLWNIAGEDVLNSAKSNDPKITGESLLPLLTGEKRKVRDYLDLEENWTFQPRFYWNAIIDNDGNMKYIFNAHTGQEQLFNLTEDPFELENLADGDNTLVWRQRLIEQFKEEGRGPLFLRDDELVVPRKPLLFNKNYPCYDGYVPVYVPH